MALDLRGEDAKNKAPLLQDRAGLTTIASSLLRANHGSMKSLMVTSCRAKEGKTVTAMNIGRALVDAAGKRVLYVDGNHESPGLGAYVTIPQSPGFTDFVHGRASFENIVYDPQNDGLSVIPAGSPGPRNLDHYRMENFKNILTTLGENFDLVIFDGPSVFGKQDLGTIAGAFDGVILVIECEKTPWEVAQSARKRLEEMGANILGATMNKRKYYIPRGLYV